MRVFKFGGASVKDADAVRNVAAILSKFAGEEIVVVVSAMGKTTNALEKIVDAYYDDKGEPASFIDEVRNYHLKIIDDLGFEKDHAIRAEIENSFVQIDWIIAPETKSRK